MAYWNVGQCIRSPNLISSGVVSNHLVGPTEFVSELIQWLGWGVVMQSWASYSQSHQMLNSITSITHSGATSHSLLTSWVTHHLLLRN